MSHNRYHGVDAYLVSQVRYHARRLSHYPIMQGWTCQDIEQQLMLDFLLEQSRFNPDKASWATFVDRVLHSRCKNLINKVQTENRRNNLHEVSPESDNDEDSQFHIEDSELHWQLLSRDIAHIAENLPPNLAWLLVNLQTHTVTEMSAETNIPCKTLHTRLRKLRKLLIENGWMDCF